MEKLEDKPETIHELLDRLPGRIISYQKYHIRIDQEPKEGILVLEYLGTILENDDQVNFELEIEDGKLVLSGLLPADSTNIKFLTKELLDIEWDINGHTYQFKTIDGGEGGSDWRFVGFYDDNPVTFEYNPVIFYEYPPSIKDIEIFLEDDRLKIINPVARKKKLDDLLERKFELDGGFLEFQEFLGAGNEGRVYKGLFNKKLVAVKAQIYEQTFGKPFQSEIDAYELMGTELPEGIPEFYGSYIIENDIALAIYELLGPSLDNLHEKEGNFSRERVLDIFRQVLNLLEFLGKRGIVHCDIKPANLLTKGNRIYLSDFGFMRLWSREKYIERLRDWDPDTHSRFGGKMVRGITGTPLYAAARLSSETRMAPMDDIEGLIYSCMFLLCGDLPWFNLDLQGLSVDAYWKLLSEIKTRSTPSKICPNSKKLIRCLELLRNNEPDDLSLYKKLKMIMA